MDSDTHEVKEFHLALFWPFMLVDGNIRMVDKSITGRLDGLYVWGAIDGDNTYPGGFKIKKMK